MIEFLKGLPLGISVPYLMFKFSDNIRKYLLIKRLNIFPFRIRDDTDLMIHQNDFLPDAISISFCERSKNPILPPNAICNPYKESKTIYPNLLEPIPLALIVNDRKIIDSFYEHVEEEYKNGDQTKLILTLGKDPFKYCDIFFNDQKYGGLFKSLSKDFLSAIQNEPISLWS